MTEPLKSSPAALQEEQVDGLVAAAGADGAMAILDAFNRSTVELLNAIGENLREGLLDDASRTAHALKGSAANVGAAALAESGTEIEEACKNGDGAVASARLSDAQQRYLTFCEAFKAHLEKR
ncbi:Hpt domain-containing protein [Hyphococcus flavus]|uniref:Hpt domain-containing protein n=1 Tax=Hyphococcus flavus TaxID=1866326 RepID=A0AAF0CBX0_9PROT|nr:Hpt domain-containing protein [Hyphococcus flavus]WDI32050.1 Hpt domain-containing protein [Hyphococcus flavus]